MGALLGLGLVLGLGLLAMGGSRRTTTPAGTSTGAGCSATPAAAARLDRIGLIAWVDCATRTAVQVAECRRLLVGAGRSDDASRVLARWNARRTVEDERGTGTLRSPSSAARASDALDPQHPPPSTVDEEPHGTVTFPTVDDVERVPSGSTGTTPGIPAGYDPTLARSLVGETVRALARRTNYRTILTRFQRAAGLTADGIYGGMSENALRYYGGSPPAAFRRPAASEGRAAYQPPTVT